MPRPVPLPLRQAIYRRLQHENDVSVIAEELQLPVRTVRHLIHKFRQDGAKLTPDYTRNKCLRSPAVPPLIEAALAMRTAHGGWGAGLIRVLLAEDHPSQTIPSERTIRRWLSRLGSEPAAGGRRPATNACRASRPHEVWQMDAADQRRLETGQLISWLRVVDECSGAVLKTVIFSRGKLQSGVPSPSAVGFKRLVRNLGNARAVPSR
jgi:hypothetical protein